MVRFELVDEEWRELFAGVFEVLRKVNFTAREVGDVYWRQRLIGGDVVERFFEVVCGDVLLFDEVLESVLEWLS